jgi:hypothetical protein
MRHLAPNQGAAHGIITDSADSISFRKGFKSAFEKGIPEAVLA